MMNEMKKIVNAEELFPIFRIPKSMHNCMFEVTICPVERIDKSTAVDLSSALLSEASLAKDWMAEEEEKAWENL